uniref:Uncharacterized protein n=1 Tax=Chromera velia CCMP2878 TaxID=1169474 RepID=A0A0G4HW03_9ALVE|eukprot:Cvel_32441.t1-p1 / transcript=Cvel_32441.t1 / gene=Cvel_32441 / organism=Chromera_velia_CCMP2878 / gene_product=hypothetical protein / transcript_product=hypothetical protein / location=Cvel_scaffold5048:4378-5091(+) / protein_length=238 / sequence_SO=supercontig / SO=protein_coding / is_pseudo=false
MLFSSVCLLLLLCSPFYVALSFQLVNPSSVNSYLLRRRRQKPKTVVLLKEVGGDKDETVQAPLDVLGDAEAQAEVLTDDASSAFDVPLDDEPMMQGVPAGSGAKGQETAPQFPCAYFPRCDGSMKPYGCRGNGRIWGGVAEIPGFDWWPIKASRPCVAAERAGYDLSFQGNARFADIASGIPLEKWDRDGLGPVPETGLRTQGLYQILEEQKAVAGPEDDEFDDSLYDDLAEEDDEEA